MHTELGPKGLEILGFPCNQFGAQEPGTEEEILNFASTTYGVKFPMFSKIDVNGGNAHNLYNFLKDNSELNKEGKTEDIPWNFAKFLVNKEGKVIKYYHPKVNPEEFRNVIEEELA